MGNSNSTSKQKGKNQSFAKPSEVDSSFAHQGQGTFQKNRRRQKKKIKEPAVGIVSHPYHQENPGQYQDEYSSSSDDDNDNDHDHDHVDFDQSLIEPRGLFQQDSVRESSPSRNSRSRFSMDSLAYSADSAAVRTFGSETTNCIGIGPVSDDPSTGSGAISNSSKSTSTVTSVPTKSKTSKASKKKKGLFRLKQHKKTQSPVPYEKSLSFVMDKAYGKSPARQEVRPAQQKLIPNEYQASHSHHRNRSLFDGRLPTIADVSYQSSTGGDYSPDENKSSQSKKLSTSNILGDLVEDEYEEECDSIHQQQHSQDDKENSNDASMVSQEYTVTTVEADELAYPYSVTKNVKNLTNIKLMLDQQHASYVEGEELVEDIDDMPTTNLGNLFANVNLTLNMSDTMNKSKYQTLDRSSHDNETEENESGVNVNMEGNKHREVHETSPGQAGSVQQTSLDLTVDVHAESIDHSSVAGNSKKSLSDQDSLNQNNTGDEDADDSFDRFVLDRTVSKRDSGNNFNDSDDGEEQNDPSVNEEKSDILDQNGAKDTMEVLSDSSLEESENDESIFHKNPEEINDVLSESSADDSKMDESLFQTSSGDYQSVLSESSAEDSRIDDSVYQNKENDAASVSSHSTTEDQTNEDLLNHSDSNFQDNSLNRTDMAIQENVLDRTDMAIVLRDVDTNMEMLDTFNGQDEDDEVSASTLLAECNASPESNSASTQSTAPVQKKEGANREHSPFPTMESNAVPTSSALTNLLPKLSHDDTDDEDDLYFQQKEATSLKEGEDEVHVEPISDIKPVNAVTLPHPKMENSIGNPYRGPEIGTVIQLHAVKKEPKMDNKAGEMPTTVPLIETQNGSKQAFSRQVAKNGAFLFNGKRNPSQPKDISKVDNQRLSMLQVEKEDRRTSSLSFSAVDISEDDSLETIQKKLMQFKIENKKANTTSRQSSVSISRSIGEIRINGERSTSRRALAKNTQATTHPFPVYKEPVPVTNSSVPHIPESSQSVPLTLVSSTTMVDQDTKKSFAGSKRNRLDAHLSSHDDSPRTKSEENSQSDLVSKDSTNYDDISISDLHKKYSAITPMKTKSPHIRFKKALRMFDAHHEKSKVTSEPRKTPPRKNASAAKEDFVFSKVTSIDGRLRQNSQRSLTSIDGRLRQNSQRSLKKKRRLTSGNDAIAPRKPTLVNPLFRNLTKTDDISDEVVDDSSVESLKGSACLDSSNFDHLEEENVDKSQEVEAFHDNRERGDIDDSSDEVDDDSSVESLKGSACLDLSREVEVFDDEHETGIIVVDEENNTSVPYDENDELDLSSSSSTSNRSSLSIGEIASLINSAHTEISGTSFESPVRQLTGLRSAMKKSCGDRNENNRVSWFAGADNEAQSPLETFQNRLAYSPNADSVGTGSSQSPPRPISQAVNAVVNPRDQKPKIHNEPMRTGTKRTCIVYSPTHDSLDSSSPQMATPIVTREPTSPTLTTDHDITSSKENEVPSMKGSPESISPMQTFRENASVIPSKREGPAGTSELNLSPGPGRRTPSQNRKWTNTPSTNSPTKKSSVKKSWRDLKADHDAKKKKKVSSKKKKQAKKKRLSGISKTTLFL